MTANDVIMMLTDYKICKARCLFLASKINELKLLIEKKKSKIIDDEVSITSVLSDMPRGTNISSPVEKLAIKVADGYINSDIIELKYEYKELTYELEKGKQIINYVEAWLGGLSNKEKLIVELFYFEKLTWREIQLHFEKNNREYMSKSTLRRIKNDAINKILSICK